MYRLALGIFIHFSFQVPIHTSGINNEREAEELRQLRENIVSLTGQCAQLDEANRAWQQYQQTQFDNFRDKICDVLPIDENTSFDEIAQQITEQISKEREDFSERYAELEKTIDELRSGISLLITNRFYLFISHVGLSGDMQSIEPSTDRVLELNEELILLRNHFEGLEKNYKQLLIDKEDLNNQLNDRSIVVGHHSASESNIVEEEVYMVYFL
jgi:hypothetical protein